MKFLNLGCPQKLCYSRILFNCKYDIIEINTGSILFSNKKYKGRKKLAMEEIKDIKNHRIHKYKF